MVRKYRVSCTSLCWQYAAKLNEDLGFAGSVYQYTVSVVSKNHTVQPLAAVYWYITACLKNTFAGSQYTGIVDTLLQKLHMYV